ncbi:MAG: HAD-IIB family hydrolase [Sphingobacteriia bacterium]|nr:HAD-IIB family hydrolase [Sphingobacteriia bacterium]NCC38274.1 HAD-IIB family hydrolase [Gammaproteobacteria bacterium]
MIEPLLLCTDLDRTLIPNGSAPESPDARPRFRRFVAHAEIQLAYVTGRHRDLVLEAIAEHDLPEPDFVIGDVGTSLWQVSPAGWTSLPQWQTEIGRDWMRVGRDRLVECLADLASLRLQEPEKQTPLKLSYYAPMTLDVDRLKARLRARLTTLGIGASLIWSLDEAAHTGLLDILPSGASKYHAVDFLMGLLGHDVSSTLFAGDSGNDLEVLTSPIPAVLVANAHPEVREQARHRSRAHGRMDRLYCAQGGWSGMNGNYSAGILEGIAHFRPDLRPWL